MRKSSGESRERFDKAKPALDRVRSDVEWEVPFKEIKHGHLSECGGELF